MPINCRDIRTNMKQGMGNMKNTLLLLKALFLVIALFPCPLFPGEVEEKGEKTSQEISQKEEQTDAERELALKSDDSAKSPQESSNDKSLDKEEKKKQKLMKLGNLYYQEYGRAMHRERLQSELTPAQWKTTLLFHRIKLPLTAEEQKSLEALLVGNGLSPSNKSVNGANSSGKGVDSEAKEESAKSKSDEALASKKSDPSEEDKLLESIDELKEDISALQDSIAEMAAEPSEESRALSNCLLKGSAFTNYTVLDHHNGTFQTGLNPLFLWRYGDNILFEMELEIGLTDCTTDIDLEYSVIDYVFNKYLTFRCGKFLTPLGIVWEKMHPEWINKLPYLPLPYFPEETALLPKQEVGIDVRGAVPLYIYCSCDKIPQVFTYDMWISNGPSSDENGQILLDCNFSDDNNRNLAFGSRIAFRFRPDREIGLSGMTAQWNSNRLAPNFITEKPLYYNALVVDLNWNFNEYFRIMGEYIWTRIDEVNPSSDEDESHFIFSHAIDRGYWVQGSLLFGFLKCAKFLNSFEAVLRYGQVERESNHTDIEQLSIGLNYYITNKLILKNGYDINRGRTNRDNRYTFSIAYGY